jgi:hypothetical protein
MQRLTIGLTTWLSLAVEEIATQEEQPKATVIRAILADALREKHHDIANRAQARARKLQVAEQRQSKRKRR